MRWGLSSSTCSACRGSERSRLPPSTVLSISSTASFALLSKSTGFSDARRASSSSSSAVGGRPNRSMNVFFGTATPCSSRFFTRAFLTFNPADSRFFAVRVAVDVRGMTRMRSVTEPALTFLRLVGSAKTDMASLERGTCLVTSWNGLSSDTLTEPVPMTVWNMAPSSSFARDLASLAPFAPVRRRHHPQHATSIFVKHFSIFFTPASSAMAL